MVPGEDEPQSKTHNTPKKNPKRWWGGFELFYFKKKKKKKKEKIFLFLIFIFPGFFLNG